MTFSSRLSAVMLATAAFAAGAVYAPAASAADLKPIKVTIPVVGLAFYPLYVGIEKGIFAKHGLEVEVVSTSGDGPDVDALISGDAQFTVSTPNRLMTAFEQGKPLWGIMSMANRMAIDCFLNKDIATKLNISTATPIDKRFQALKGQTVAGTRPGSFTYLLLLGYAKRFGLEPQKDIQVIGVGGGASMIGAVENSQVAVACSASPLPEQAVSRGKSVMLTDNTTGKDPVYDNFLFEVLYVKPEYAKANPAIVKSMTASLLESVAYMLDTPDKEQLPLLKKYFSGTPDDILLQAFENTKPIFRRDGHITDEAVDKASDFLIQTGALTKKAKPSDITTNQFLP
jgi:NitT/TauT family transport system substrate-binding protein